MKKLLRHLGLISFFIRSSYRPIDFVSLGLFLRVTRFRDYDIVKRKIEYTQCKSITDDNLKGFWKAESRKWVDHESSHVIYNRDIKNFPSCVVNYKYTIKYYYKGSFYNYMTTNRVGDIEDVKKNNTDARMIFRVPLYSAYKDTTNVSKTLIKYLGPRGDCHGLNLTPYDIFGDGDYLFVFKSILGTTVIKNYESIPQF